MASSRELTNARRRDAAKLTQGFRSVFVFLFVMSGIINVLALTGSLYMLQVYDRALTSGSVQTLMALSALGDRALSLPGRLRRHPLPGAGPGRRQARRGDRADRPSGGDRHAALRLLECGSARTGRDVDTVRGFLGSQGPSALFDLPWIPLYLAFVYFLHPWLGALTFAGAFLLTLLTVLSEVLTRRLNGTTRQAAIVRNTIADSNARNAEVLKAMGFAGRAVERFDGANREHLAVADAGQ